MTDNLDRAVLELSTDDSQFNAGIDRAKGKAASLGDSFKKTAKDAEDAGNSISGFFGKIVSGVASGELLASALEKIGEGALEALKSLPELVEHTMHLGSEMVTMSEQTGISVEGLSKLRYVAAQTGTDMTTLTSSIFRMEANLGGVGAKGKAAQDAIAALHLSVSALKNERPEEAFVQVLDKIGELPTAAQQAAAGMAVFGKSFKDIAQLAHENVGEVMKEAEDLGIVMTTDMAAAAKAAEDSLTSLKFQIEGVGIRIGAAFLPAIIGVSGDLQTLFKGAIDDANKSLDAMGKPGSGFLATVATAMGTGEKAIGAQTQLYYDLRSALISVVQGGIEPLITAIGFLGKEWDAALVLANMVVVGYQGVTYAAEGLLLVFAEVAKYTDPFGASKAQQNIDFLKKDLDRLYNSMAVGQAKIDDYKRSEQDWDKTTADINAHIEAGLKNVAATHVDVAATIAKVHKMIDAATAGTGQALDEEGDATDGFAKKLATLTKQIDAANAHGVPMTEQVKLFGDAASKATMEADVWGVHVKDDVQAVADAFNKGQLDKILERATAQLNKQAQTAADEWSKQMIASSTASFEATQKASEDNLKILDSTSADIRKIVAESNKQTLEDTLKNIHDDANARRAALKERGQYTKEALDAIDRYEEAASHKAVHDWSIDNKALEDNSRETLQHVADRARATYEAMAADPANYSKATIEHFKEIADAAQKAADGVEFSFHDAFTSLLDDLPHLLEESFSSGGGWAKAGESAGIQLAQGIEKGLSARLTKGQKTSISIGGSAATAVGGATEGNAGATAASIASSSGGAILASMGVSGVALGVATMGIGLAAVGVVALVKYLKGAEVRHIMSDVGTDWGTAIDQALAKQIKATEGAIEGFTKNQRRDFAEALNASAIEQEAGGINASNVRKFEQNILPLFDLVKKGGKDAGMAVTVINEQIGEFAAQAEKTGGMWDPVLKNLIQQSKDLGLNLDAVNQAIDAQISKLGTGLNSVTTGAFAGVDQRYTQLTQGLSTDEVSALHDPMQSAKVLKDLNESGHGSEANQYQAAIAGFTQLSTGAQESFDRLSRVALASFNTIVASGHSAFDAIGQLGGSIDTLIAEHDKLGLHGGAAYDQLARLRTLTQGNQALVDSVSGLNDVLTALANLGGLDADSFKDLEDQGVSAFNQMTAAGFTQQEAEQALVPFLQNVIDLHNKNGLAIDDETQKLIDQAQKDGVLKDKEISTNQILIDGIGALIKAVGGDLPESFKKFSKAGTDAAGDVQGAINRIPKHVDIGVKYNQENEVPEPPQPRDANGSGDSSIPTFSTEPTGPGLRASTGAIVPEYLAVGGPIGTDTVPAWLTPGEGVLNVDAMRQLGADAFDALNDGESLADAVFKNLPLNQPVFMVRPTERAALAPTSAERFGVGSDGLARSSGGTVHVTINAIDGASVQRLVESRDFQAAFIRAKQRSTFGLGAS